MSTYIVSDNEILLVAAIYCQRQWEPMLIVSKQFPALKSSIDILIAENYCSVNIRYSKETQESIPFDYTKYKNKHGEIDSWLLVEAAIKIFKKYTVVEKLKIVNNYRYQCCEAENWGSTHAKQISDICIFKLVDQLPGYDDAPWGID